MFESFCALLLRLYPAEFRRAYGRDAVQLMRDRARHERGVFLRLRLLTDLLIDLGETSFRGWQPQTPSLASVDGTLRLGIIAIRSPRADALGAGIVIAAMMFASFPLLFQRQTRPATPISGFAFKLVPGGGNDVMPQAAAVVPDAKHQLVAAIAANLQQHYFNRVVGQQLAGALREHDKNGDYQSLAIGANLVARINKDIQTTSRGLGIAPGVFVADVVYSGRPLPTGPPPPITAEMQERNREAMLEQKCLFERTEILPHGVGYLKVNGFADAAVCHDTTARAMASLNHADALIVDLRDNGGGLGDTALQIAAYLFARPTYMWDPRAGSPVAARTPSPVPGNRLVDKPVYVLTSSTTQSAAEYFVYNLKMLKRATIVGETTAGHQHSGGFYRVDDHVGMGIQDAVPPDNPYSIKGWEIIGIEPDVKIPRSDAVDAARRLAESRTRPR